MNIWCKINDYQQDITYIIRIFIYKSPTYSQDSRKSIESKKYAICVRGSGVSRVSRVFWGLTQIFGIYKKDNRIEIRQSQIIQLSKILKICVR